MTTLSALTCEVLVDGAWRTFRLDEARLKHRGAAKRCPRCRGQVSIQGIYSAQGYTTLSHRRSHDGCPLIQRHYKGVPKRHPQPVE